MKTLQKWIVVSLFLLSCCGSSEAGDSPEKSVPNPPKSTPKKQSAPASPQSPGKIRMGGKGGWTGFRGGPGRTGRSDVKGPRRAKLKWVFRTKGRLYGDAAISRDGDTIYQGSHDGFMYAVDRDGNRKWAYDAGGKIWTSPAISEEGKIYFGADNDRLFALNPDGTLHWDFATEEPPPKKGPKPEAGRFDVDTSPLVLDDGTVVFGCHLKLFALRPMKGDVRWIFEAGKGRSKIFSSAAMGGDGTIYFGTQGNFLFALNQSAKVLWSLKTDGDNDSTPSVDADGTVFFGSDDGFVRSIAAGGVENWKVDLKASIRAPLAIGKGRTLLVSTYGAEPFLAALDMRTGEEKWRFRIQPGAGDFYGIQSGATVDAEGYIYFGGRDHFIYCLSPDGQLVWKYETGDQVDASPVLGPDGTLYVGSDDKRLYAFSSN